MIQRMSWFRLYTSISVTRVALLVCLLVLFLLYDTFDLISVEYVRAHVYAGAQEGLSYCRELFPVGGKVPLCMAVWVSKDSE